MDKRFDRRDMDRNENPREIAGAVTGATGAGVGGAAGLAALGPVGGVVGALAGALGGWWVGKGFERAVEEMDRAEKQLRRRDDGARHGFRLGYLAGRNPRYENTRFSAVEEELRAAWVKTHLQDEAPAHWADVRDDVRAGFETARDEA